MCTVGQDERDTARRALIEDVERLEKKREDAEERASALETEALALKKRMGDAEILARDAKAERDK